MATLVESEEGFLAAFADGDPDGQVGGVDGVVSRVGVVGA
jgi:hypothetical protein